MRRFAILLMVLGVAGCGGDDKKAEQKTEKPAKVEKLPGELELARITLTPKAEERLGIALTTVEKIELNERRLFAGELVIPSGKSVIVSAPVAGIVSAPDDATIPLPGSRVKPGQVVLKLVPMLTPERDVPTPAERVQMANARATLATALAIAEGDVQGAKVEQEAAGIALKRAKKLLESRAGSARAVDDAQARADTAEATLKAATARKQELARLAEEINGESEPKGAVRPLSIDAPQVGVMQNLLVSRGGLVTAGSPLFEVADVGTLWVRVPIYVGQLAEIDTQRPALIVGLDGRPGKNDSVAEPVAAPLSADPLSSSTHLFYSLKNADQAYQPGQRVGVELPLTRSGSYSVVPVSALLYDVQGGVWVYVQSGEHQFERRRVMVRFTQEGMAALSEGPPVGTQVVTDGTAELFGTEFGAGK